MPSSPKSPRSTQGEACACDGGGTLVELANVAEQLQLIIVSRYTIGARQLAVVPCECAAGQAVARAWRNLPGEAEGVTFSTLLTLPNAAWQSARAKAQAFVADPRGWLTLAGNYGTGKTKLLYATLNGLAERGIYGRYVLLPEMLEHLRDGFKAGLYADRLQALARAPVLAIDELDKFRDDSPWIAEVLEALFLARYREARYTGTVLVYNRDRQDRLPPFLQSRMRDSRFAFVELTGVDLRTKADKLDPWDRGE